ncbi:MAG: S41 family peptidase [Candidatus Eisenbacteria bacterium]|uniref:S41 family peptidase n=1 Tax=Eiseniibacteriota bacterium TaxID=2212470 RepID=A0A948RWZ0_UNCEI|nr:S41 family peptidase [Candidatus Eisenbacteria bacterium]MBU1951048.1 S41 family peptidase [Candidatus Eisenbacteria bacterium]MBU2689779.1 S41 family peptidase [Candidatus Eisenbacteria bacterium]
MKWPYLILSLACCLFLSPAIAQEPIDPEILDSFLNALDEPGDSIGSESAGPFDENWDPLQEETPAALGLFDQVWEEFDRTYPYFDYKGIDWNDLKESHRSDFAGDLAPDEFVDKLAILLRELRDFHVSIRKPDGGFAEVYNRQIERNYTSDPRNRYSVSGYETMGDGVIRHGWLADEIAYIRIDTFAREAYAPLRESDIDKLFTQYGNARGMIIDIRPNNGGDETIAAGIAGWFTDKPLTYGYTARRNGPGHDEFEPPQKKVLEPHEGGRYAGPVACLIGERCMSSAEWFTLMMKACPQVTLIGSATRGSSGNPAELRLPNGVVCGIPSWMAFTSEMKPFEDVGLPPEITIPAEESFDAEHDFVVERAIRELLN